MEKKTTLLSWLSLIFSIVPIFIFTAMLGGSNFSEIELFSPLIVALILAVLCLIKKNEKNLLPIISLIVSVGSGSFMLLIITVSQMGQPS
ncbi:hypothetical protein [Gracilibacillus salinarum]|uniref:Uncharacterized protein n=1 Tax=Gracilibacillus salinarum TaxID=2932255 RepID=A0ABY4GIZ0_9BACI|nr:hypothetical protein [Gracilibacillus salinarum]UOQ84328.1 hypothetical protein MUN87_16770 [Gracilibacillus salinarum]